MNLKLSEVDQDVFCKIDPAIYPVDNKWGKQGWTTVNLPNVREEIFKDALMTAYNGTLPKK